MSDIILGNLNTANIIKNVLEHFINERQLEKEDANSIYQSILDEKNDEIRIKHLLHFVRRHSRYVEMVVNQDKYLTVTNFEIQLKNSFADLSLYYEEELIDFAFIDLAKHNAVFFLTSLIKFHYGLSDLTISRIVQVEAESIRSISQISYSFLIGYVASKRRDSLVNIIRDSDFKKINSELLIQDDQKVLFKYTLNEIESIIIDQNNDIVNMNKKVLKMTELLINKIDN